MPLTATNGALTYSRTNLGDPNFTYWMLKGTGSSIASLKGMYVDDINNYIYLQTTQTSTNKPSLIKLNRLVGPDIEYNKIYSITSPSGGTYGSMSYLSYDSSTNSISIPFRYNRTYQPGPAFIVGSATIVDIDATDGSVTNDYNRFPVVGVPSGNNTIYTTTFDSGFISNGNRFLAILEVGNGTNLPIILAYTVPNVIQYGTATVNLGVNANPLFEFGRLIFNSLEYPIHSSMIYGTSSNEIRWYTNSTILTPPSTTFPTLYATSFTLTNKRLEVGGIALDSTENRLGVIGNTTDNISYVIKTSSTQVLSWQKAIAGVRLHNVTVDSSDNIYVAGNIVSNGRLYFAKFDSSGTVIYQRQIYGTGAYGIPNIFCDVNDMLYLSCSDGTDPLAMRLPIDGTLTGSYVLGSSTITYASVSQVVSNGTLSVTTPVNTLSTGNDYKYPLSITTTAASGNTTSNRIPIS